MSLPLSPPQLDYTKVTLPNGLDVILRRQGDVPLVAANLWYHVGSKNEERNRRGLAHLFEHLMFEGSQHFPGDYFKPLQRVGASVNGSTSTDRTNYYADLPASHLELVLAMESDRMANLLPALTEEKLRIQKDVVKNEYRQNYENRPYGRVWRLLAESLFPPDHPYSWTTIGVMEDLEPASRDECAAFFSRNYVPSNASLAIVGDIDPDAALALAERYFGPIPGGANIPPVRAPKVALDTERQVLLRDRVELDRVYLVWHTVPQFAPDDAALSLLGDILGGGRTSRLYQALVVKGQIAQDVGAYQSGRELAGTFAAICTLRPGRSIAEAREAIDREVTRVIREGVTAEELERIKRKRLAAFIYALDSIGGFGGVADRLNAYNTFLGDPGRVTSDFERYRDLTPDNLQRVAKQYLDTPGRVSLEVTGRAKASTTAPPDRAVKPVAPPPAAYRAPVPESHRLRCGSTAWVIPRPGLPIVAAAAAFRGGASTHSPARGGLAKLTAEMLPEGTRNYDSLALAEAAEDIGTSLNSSFGWDGTHAGMTCLAPHLRRSLELAVEFLFRPTFPEPEWGRIQAQALASLRAQKDQSESLAHRAWLRLLYPPAHPFSMSLDGTEATVSGLSLDDLRAFHASAYRSDRGLWVLAGDFDPDQALKALDELLGPEPFGAAAGAQPEWPEPSAPEGNRVVLVHRPGATQSVVKLGQVGPARSTPDFWPLALWNHILGGGFVSRLNSKLREEKGFTYGIRSHFDHRSRGGFFAVSASLQADRIGEALQDIRGEVQALLEGRPPTPSEFDDARRSLIEGQARHFESPGALAGRFAGLHLLGLPADEYHRTPDRIAEVTVEGAGDAARRHLNPASWAVVAVGDAAVLQPQLEQLGWGLVEVVEAAAP